MDRQLQNFFFGHFLFTGANSNGRTRTLDLGMVNWLLYHCATTASSLLLNTPCYKTSFHVATCFWIISQRVHRWHFCLSLYRCQRQGLFSNPRPWDDELSVLPLCHCYKGTILKLLFNVSSVFSIVIISKVRLTRVIISKVIIIEVIISRVIISKVIISKVIIDKVIEVILSKVLISKVLIVKLL